MAGELLDIYDAQRQPLGTMDRNEVHRRGLWHRTIHCWVVRAEQEPTILFQLRSATKALGANQFDITAAGHYAAGESPRDGVREIREELGIEVNFTELHPLGIRAETLRQGPILNREFADVYLLLRHESPADYTVDPEEVAGLFEFPITEAIALFSGEIGRADAAGIQWDSQRGRFLPARRSVSAADWIARDPDYYLWVFRQAQALLAAR